jgi:hypothetical protein
MILISGLEKHAHKADIPSENGKEVHGHKNNDIKSKYNFH